MEAVTHYSIRRAADEAVKLWAFASAQYPKQHDLILAVTTESVIEAISSFALNARRALEILPSTQKFQLAQSRWKWAPKAGSEKVHELKDSLHRIIHAQKLNVGFEELPRNMSVIDGGSLVIPYVQAETDRKKLAFIDPFALAHTFLYEAFPRLIDVEKIANLRGVH